MSYTTSNSKNDTSFTISNIEKNTSYSSSNTEKDTTWSLTSLDASSTYSVSNTLSPSDFLFYVNFTWNLNTTKWNDIQTIWGR